jgi:hypothetical protein
MTERKVYPYTDIQKGMWRHYKGGVYDVFALSRDESTGVWCVVYRNLQTGDCFHRPAAEWRTVVNASTGLERFQKVQDE